MKHVSRAKENTIKAHLVIAALIGCMLSLLSCGTGSSGTGMVGTAGTTTSTGTTSTLSPTAITNSADGAEAAALVIQSKELVVTSTTLMKNLGFITKTYMVSATTGTGSGSCTDYGTYTYSSTYNSASQNYVVSLTFSLCREDGFQYDGVYAAYGKASQFTGQLGGLTIMNFKNNYTTLIGSLVGLTLSYSMEGSGDDSNATYTFMALPGFLWVSFRPRERFQLKLVRLI